MNMNILHFLIFFLLYTIAILMSAEQLLTAAFALHNKYSGRYWRAYSIFIIVNLIREKIGLIPGVFWWCSVMNGVSWAATGLQGNKKAHRLAGIISET